MFKIIILPKINISKTDMIIMMGLQRHLQRRSRDRQNRRDQGRGSHFEDEDSDDDGEDIFLSDVIAALLAHEEEFEELD